MDKGKWLKAEEIVKKQYKLTEKDGEKFYKLVSGVYKNMKGGFVQKEDKHKFKQAKNESLIISHFLLEDDYTLPDRHTKRPYEPSHSNKDPKTSTEKVVNKIEKAGDAGKKIKDSFKEIYGKSDEELITGERNIFKTITKAIMFGGLWVINPAVALIGWYVDRRLKSNINAERRNKLLNVLDSELNVIEAKLNDATEKEEKYKLMKLRDNYKRAINKVRYAKVT
jgi:hypothetical protein